MKLKYVGPYDEVEIAATGQTCARGGSVDVKDDLAASLLEQADNWIAADKAKNNTKDGD